MDIASKTNFEKYFSLQSDSSLQFWKQSSDHFFKYSFGAPASMIANAKEVRALLVAEMKGRGI